MPVLYLCINVATIVRYWRQIATNLNTKYLRSRAQILVGLPSTSASEATRPRLNPKHICNATPFHCLDSCIIGRLAAHTVRHNSGTKWNIPKEQKTHGRIANKNEHKCADFEAKRKRRKTTGKNSIQKAKCYTQNSHAPGAQSTENTMNQQKKKINKYK